MKKLLCPDCKKTRNYGKFCLDCGTPLTEVITSDTKFKRMKTNRSSSTLKIDVRNWLGRIGVQQGDIKIAADGEEAKITYALKGQTYSFTSNLQDSEADNLAAVEQFIHHRVIGIERGIETEEQAFAGYTQLPDLSNLEAQDPYQALGFKEPVDKETAKKKYKELARKFHPDVNNSPEAARQFQSLKRAIDKIENENQ